VAEALAAAKSEAAENDKIVVFGSFVTVAGAYG
jgi:folylpolyglutamate synthase/dihydropteroate synthase